MFTAAQTHSSPFRYMRRRVASIAAVGALLTSSVATPALAQTVAGRALDSRTRKPLAGLTVGVIDSAELVYARSTTDTTGAFYVDAPKGGTWRLVFLGGAAIPFITGTFAVPDGAMHEGIWLIDRTAIEGELPYFEFEVTKPVVPAPGSPLPRYPADLRSRGIAGQVLAQFVVDTLGRVEVTSFKVLRSTDAGFVAAVHQALGGMRFIPAELDGRKVRQLVQQPYIFNIASGGMPPDQKDPMAVPDDPRCRGGRPPPGVKCSPR